MTQKKQSKAAASRSRGAAARAEKTQNDPEPKELTFRGQKLQAPPNLEGEGAFFAFTDFAAHAEEGISFVAAHRLIESILGRQQVLSLSSKLNGPGDYLELLTELLGVYGFELGEASASAES